MKKARIAVIGLGWIGYRHAQLALETEGAELVALCDSGEHAQRLAAQLDRPLYGDHIEMLSQENLDGVVIATPTGLHVPVGIDCAERGMHLLVEKPLADSVDEAQRLVQVAEQEGVKLLVGHYRRFNPAVAEARKMIQEGQAGRLVGVCALWSVLKEDAYFAPEWRRKPGAGPVLTNLVHDVDCLRYICGDIVSVQSAVSAAVRNFEVEDTAAVLLEFANGAVGTVLVSDAASSPWGFEAATGDNPDIFATGENCYHFLCTEGSFSFPELNVWSQPGEQHRGWRHPIVKERRGKKPRSQEPEALALQMSHFVRVIHGEDAPKTCGRDGLKTLAVTRAVLEADEKIVFLPRRGAGSAQ